MTPSTLCWLHKLSCHISATLASIILHAFDVLLEATFEEHNTCSKGSSFSRQRQRAPSLLACPWTWQQLPASSGVASPGSLLPGFKLRSPIFLRGISINEVNVTEKHLVGEFVLIWSTHANKKIVRGLLMTHQIWLHLKPELSFSCPRWMFWDFFTPWIQRWTQQLSVHAPCYFLSHTPLISFWRPLPFFHAWLAAAFVQWQRSSSVKGELVLLGPCGWSVSGHFCAGRGFLQPTPPSDVHSTLEQHALFIKKKEKKRKNGGCQLQHLLMNQCGIFLPPLGFTCSSSNSLSLLFMYEYSLPERISHTVRDQQWMLNHWFDSGPFTFNGS